MVPRFSFPFDAGPPQSVADKLLEFAETLEIKLLRRDSGNITAMVELHATLGADFFCDDDDADAAEQSRKSLEALHDVKVLLGAFATAGSRGDV